MTQSKASDVMKYMDMSVVQFMPMWRELSEEDREWFKEELDKVEESKVK